MEKIKIINLVKSFKELKLLIYIVVYFTIKKNNFFYNKSKYKIKN
jgi:hypothetical protein